MSSDWLSDTRRRGATPAVAAIKSIARGTRIELVLGDRGFIQSVEQFLNGLLSLELPVVFDLKSERQGDRGTVNRTASDRRRPFLRSLITAAQAASPDREAPPPKSIVSGAEQCPDAYQPLLSGTAARKALYAARTGVERFFSRLNNAKGVAFVRGLKVRGLIKSPS